MKEESTGSKQAASGEAKDEASSKETPKRRVSFQSGTKEGPTKTMPRPKKATHFGKANPVRDIFLFIGIIAFLMWIGGQMDPTRKKSDKEKGRATLTKAVDSVNKLVSDSLTKIAHAMDKNRRTESCSLFLDEGSIPGTGLSFFAGENFKTGDVVVEAPMLLPLHGVFVPPHALLLKHHPFIVNVEGVLISGAHDTVLTKYQLRASRPIKAGEELFLAPDDHLQRSLNDVGSSLFEHIPMIGDYALADEITLDAIQSIPVEKTSKKKVSRRASKDFIYSLLQRTVKKFNSRVAALLPNGTKDAVKFSKDGQPSYFASLRNKTLLNLQTTGTCLEDVQGEVDSLKLANRNVKKGDVVAKVPLYVTKNTATCEENERECTVSKSSCYGHDDSPLLFCPLTVAAFVEHIETGDANVEYRWSIGEAEVSQLSADEALACPVGQLVWNVVALRHIEAGEKVSSLPGEESKKTSGWVGAHWLFPCCRTTASCTRTVTSLRESSNDA